MKQFLLMAFAVLITVTGVHAQHTKQNRAQEQKKEWRSQRNMNLTQEQKDQMQKLREEARIEREKIGNDKSLTDAQRSEKLKTLQKEQREKMNSLLTKEQREKMMSNRNKMRQANRPERMRTHRNPMRSGMQNQYGKLDLTKTQQEQLNKINAESKAKREAIKNDSKLSEEQRMQKMKELNVESRKQRDAVLTKEQKEQLKSMRSDGQGRGKRPAHRSQSSAK